MKQALDLITDAFDAIVISFLAAVACVLLIEEWRATKAYYFIGGWATGIIIGIAAQRMGVPAGYDIIVTAVAVVTAPVTISWLRHKSILDAIDQIRQRRRSKKEDDQED